MQRIFSPPLVGSQHLLNLRNRTSRVQALGASSRAVEDSVAAVHAHAVIQSVLSLGGVLVTRVGQPAVGLEENGRAEILLAVPPVRGTRGRAAGAQNALVQTVQLLTLLGALAVLEALRLSDTSSQRRCEYSHLGLGSRAAGKA